MVRVRSIVAHFHPLLRRRLNTQALESRKLGQLGEKVAREWVWASGRKVLYRNFRARGGGEVDLVVRERDVLCFVEVKARSSTVRGRPSDAVGQEKQRLIQKGAEEWLRLLGTRDLPWRFDIMEVLLQPGERPEVKYLKDAF